MVTEPVQPQMVRKTDSREVNASERTEEVIKEKEERRQTPSSNEGVVVLDAVGGGGVELDSLNNGSMVFVNELQTQLEYLKKTLSLRGIDLEAVGK